MSAVPPDFTVRVERALAAEGVRGLVARLSFDGQTIRIAGADGTMLEIPLETIDRIRVGIAAGTRPGHQLMVWRSGSTGSLALRLHSPWAPYPEAIRAIVSALVLRRGIGRIELGTTTPAALFNALFFAGILGCFLYLALYSFRLGLWPIALGFLAVSLFFPRLFLAIAREQRPRALRSLEELEQVLKMPSKKGTLKALRQLSQEQV